MEKKNKTYFYGFRYNLFKQKLNNIIESKELYCYISVIFDLMNYKDNLKQSFN